MRQLFLIASLLFFTLNVQSQYSFAKSEEFEDIQSRPLIVEQLELDQKLIAKWKKKAKKPKNSREYNAKISKYKTFVTDYNTMMKRAVEEHWELNSEFIFKTTSEVNQLMKDDSEEYTVLWYDETDSGKKNDFGATFFPNQTVPTLKYSRSEKGRFKTDYCYFMHFSNRNTHVKERQTT